MIETLVVLVFGGLVAYYGARAFAAKDPFPSIALAASFVGWPAFAVLNFSVSDPYLGRVTLWMALPFGVLALVQAIRHA